MQAYFFSETIIFVPHSTRLRGRALTWALACLALLWLLLGSSGVARADDLTVCPDGPPTCDYDVIQEAVDAAAPGDVVKVATGVYTGTHDRPSPPGYDGPSVITQVVHISQSLTLQGGYTVTNWIEPDPEANPTTVDAQGGGRALFATGPGITVTVGGLRFTNGDAAGLGGGTEPWRDAGGGVYVLSATFALSGNWTLENAAQFGGGLYLESSPAIVEGNTIADNQAEYQGGGLYANASDGAVLRNNLILTNTVLIEGGGVYLDHSDALLDGNTIGANLADGGDGGGLYSTASDVTLVHNLIVSNTCEMDAGAYLEAGTITLSENTILSNTANYRCGGLHLSDSPATLEKNTVRANTASSVGGGGVCVSLSPVTFTKNIISLNSTDNIGGGLSVWESDVTLNGNNILSNTADSGGGLHAAGSTISLTHNLISANATDGGDGGGLYLDDSDVWLAENTITNNSAFPGPSPSGGGVYLIGSGKARLVGNAIVSNTARFGGGLCVYGSDAVTLTSNSIVSNTASVSGGGIQLSSSDATLEGNTLLSNASDRGGGLDISLGNPRLINNVIADNQANTHGCGLYVLDASSRLLHNTLARNGGGDGTGVYVDWTPGLEHEFTVWLTDTILVNHTIGISVAMTGTANLEATLWGNDVDWAGDGAIITGVHNYWGDPAFLDPASGDYHIGPGSAALDRGVDADIIIDIDGDPRPLGDGYDLGADESTAALRYVATSGVDAGNDCTDPLSPCATIQHAVDVADPGDGIRVAAGVYSGTQGRPSPPGYSGPATISQTVYLSQSLALQGGYTLTNWIEPDPEANPTTLDALGGGRALFVAGPSISPTIEGLQITGGDASQLGGEQHWTPDADAGGGIYVFSATVVLSNNLVFDNVASQYLQDFPSGGGLYLYQSDAILQGNTVSSNTAGFDGGGLTLYQSQARLVSNTIRANTTTEEFAWESGGGGLFLRFSDVVLKGNTVSDNAAQAAGGGLHVRNSHVTLVGNAVSANAAANGPGGGLYLVNAELVLRDNIISGNSAAGNGDGGGLSLASGTASIGQNTIMANQTSMFGGGLSLIDCTATISHNLIFSNGADLFGGGVLAVDGDATLVNDLIVDNQSNDGGSGLQIDNSVARLLHVTFSGNDGGDGGVFVGDYGQATVWLTNTILVSHTVGLSITAGNTAILEATLWGNDVDWAGEGTIITGTRNYWGDPAFLDPAGGDYHLGPGSAALDRGVDAGVTSDIDGDPRPQGAGYDLGADEYTAALNLTKQAYLPMVLAGERLTYTLRLTNTGLVSLTPTVTDVLPAHVTPGGLLTWSLPPLAPGDTWTETVVVTVEQDYAGPLVNVLQASTLEGPVGVYTETSSVVLTLPAIPVLLAPPNGTITTTQAITLAWQAGAGSSPTGYNLDLDGDVLTTTATSSPTILALGAHTWTVRAFNQAGYSDWAEAWTVEVTETLPPPSVPTLLAPPDGTVTTTQAITLAWQAGAGSAPTGYNLDLDGSLITTTATHSVTLLSLGVHTWTVRAFNPAGYSDWAEAWTVEVTETLPPPSVPTLLAPPDGTVTTTQAITLAWQAGAGSAPTGYNLDLDGSLITTTATHSVTLLSLGVHTWTVRAFNPAGYSDWAAPWTVEVTETLPPPPPASLLSIQPDTAAANAGDLPVLIRGANLAEPVSARLNGVSLLSPTLFSTTTLQAVVPVGSLAQGAHDLFLTSAGQPLSLTGAFSVTPAASPTRFRAAVYLACDNNLESGCRSLFNQLELALTHSPDLAILALWDGYAQGDSAYFVVQPDADPYLWAEYTDGLTRFPLGEVDTADPESLLLFAAWAQSRYPAEYSLLSLVGHGGGWAPYVHPGQILRRKYEWGPGGMLWDFHPENVMPTRQLAQGLAWLAAGQLPDLTYLDACLMGATEVALELAPHTGYLVLHENLAWASYPYQAYLGGVDGGTTPLELALHITQAYSQSLPPEGHPAQIGVIDTAQLDAALSELDTLALALSDTLPAARPVISQVVSHTAHLDENGDWRIDRQDSYVDLAHLAQGLIDHPQVPTPVKTAAQGLLDALDGVVLANYTRSGQPWPGEQWWDLSQLSGLSIYFPLEDEWRRGYYTPEHLPRFGTAAWDDWIQAWYGGQTPPEPPNDPCPDCLTAPMHVYLSLETEEELEVGEVSYLPVYLNWVSQMDDVRGLQISLRVSDPAVLAPAADLPPQVGKLFAGQSLSHSLVSEAEYAFLLNTPTYPTEAISGSNLVVGLPFRALVPGCVELSFETRLVVNGAAQPINHHVLPARVCVRPQGPAPGYTVFLPVVIK